MNDGRKGEKEPRSSKKRAVIAEIPLVTRGKSCHEKIIFPQ